MMAAIMYVMIIRQKKVLSYKELNIYRQSNSDKELDLQQDNRFHASTTEYKAKHLLWRALQ